MSTKAGFLERRGLADNTADELNEALRTVLDSVKPRLYEADASGLSEQEQAVLKAGGARLEAEDSDDPFAAGIVTYAALVQNSLTTKEVGTALGLTAGRVRQLIADRSLYSFVIDNKRHIPEFQIRNGKLVGNIMQVNQVLPKRQHPVAIYHWYHLDNRDLVVNNQGDGDATLSPLEWLLAGNPVEDVITAAGYL